MNWFSLSWTMNGIGENSDKFDWQKIVMLLNEIVAKKGTLTLEGENLQGFTCSLQLRAENNAYLVTLGYETEDDWIVETLSANQKFTDKKVNILGDEWSESMISHSQDKVIELFFRFFNREN